MEFEFVFLHWLQEWREPWLDLCMKAVTFLGNGGWFWILLGVLFLCRKNTRKMGMGMLLSLLLGFLVGNILLKNLIARPRPCWLEPGVALLIPVPQDYSFPSGHTLASVEGALSIFWYNKKWGIAALILAALIAFSRMYLFVHFPTDILGGVCLGIVCTWIVNQWILPWISKKMKNRIVI